MRNNNWEPVAFEKVFTAHRDRTDQRAVVQRRMTQKTQGKVEYRRYLLLKEEEIDEGGILQGQEEVREHV